MSNVIDLTVREPDVIWAIDVGKGREEFVDCEYRQTSANCAHTPPYWFVVVEAATVDRLCVMLKKAEKQLAKEMAVMRAVSHKGTRAASISKIEGRPGKRGKPG